MSTFISRLGDDEIATYEQRAGDGPLAGLRFAIKDNIDLAGVPTTAADPSRTTPAAAHATSVARLIAAGAIPVGKTNMDQYATGLVGTRTPYGACASVFSPEHVSGGSSSGSALAVASGIVPLALGTDTAGSGRVPAAFNGLVGIKPTRGLVPTTGVLPACPSLDCVTTFTRTVAAGRAAVEVMAGPDAGDPFSRPRPPQLPLGVARQMQVIAVPDEPLDLDDAAAAAWDAAVKYAGTLGHLVRVDVTPFLAAARMLYGSALLAERYAAFGHLLEPDGPHLDPTVRAIVRDARRFGAADVYQAQHRLAVLRSAAAAVFVGADALLLPTAPGHPTLAAVAADPVGVNARLGGFTNMANLFDLCAVAVPAGLRDDGLPFGVQLLAPAFADGPLLELAARWCAEPTPAAPVSGTLLAVAGAHLTGQPANRELLELGGRLHRRERTAPHYRMHTVPGPFPRPGLVRGDGPADGLEVEVWELPEQGLGALLPRIAAPLALGAVELADGSRVTGFVADPTGLGPATDITGHGGWRAYRAAH